MRFANRMLGFVRATIIGGVFVLAPIVALVIVIGHAFMVVFKTLQPVFELLPFKSVGGVSLVVLAAISVLILLCFLAGLVANTAIARWLVRFIESTILAHLPGYALVKSMGEGIVGVDAPDCRRAVLVRSGDQSQVGFVMDRMSDGRLVVFIPSVPSPWSGSLLIVPSDQVEWLDVPLRPIIDKLQRLGDGLGATLSRAPHAK